MEEESPLSPHKNDNRYLRLEQSIYDYVTYFSLESESAVMIYPANSWDLAFSCSPDSHYVKLSGGRGGYAGTSRSFDFDTIRFAHSDSLWMDNPRGELDSTAIGRWWELSPGDEGQSEVFVINRGRTPSGGFLGKWIFQILEANEKEYKIIFSDSARTQIFNKTVPKDPDYDFVHLDFSRPDEVLNYEPKNGDGKGWDLYFGPFNNYEYYDDKSIPPIQYRVWGVLTNRPRVQTALISDTEYYRVTSSLSPELSLASEGIGITWKKYFDNTARYTVYPENIYWIRDRNGIDYKLRFHDFYKNGTLKGYPTFEYEKL